MAAKTGPAGPNSADQFFRYKTGVGEGIKPHSGSGRLMKLLETDTNCFVAFFFRYKDIFQRKLLGWQLKWLLSKLLGGLIRKHHAIPIPQVRCYSPVLR